MSALQFLSVMKKTGKKASELASVVEVLPQALFNAHVKTEYKNTYMEIDAIRKAIETLEKEFAGEGRVLIRPSGTEPLVRVMIEGNDINEITKDAQMLADLIQSRF